MRGCAAELKKDNKITLQQFCHGDASYGQTRPAKARRQRSRTTGRALSIRARGCCGVLPRLVVSALYARVWRYVWRAGSLASLRPLWPGIFRNICSTIFWPRSLRLVRSRNTAPAAKGFIHPSPHGPAFFWHAYCGKTQGYHQQGKRGQYKGQSLSRKGKGRHSGKGNQRPLACKQSAARASRAHLGNNVHHTALRRTHTWRPAMRAQASPATR